MMTALSTFIPLALGLSMLALSMPRHHREILEKSPSRCIERALRMAGWLSLVMALAVAIAFEGLAIGPVLWVGLLTIAAQCLALALAYRGKGRRSRC